MQEPNEPVTQSQIEGASYYIYEQLNEDKDKSARHKTIDTARV